MNLWRSVHSSSYLLMQCCNSLFWCVNFPTRCPTYFCISHLFPRVPFDNLKITYFVHVYQHWSYRTGTGQACRQTRYHPGPLHFLGAPHMWHFFIGSLPIHWLLAMLVQVYLLAPFISITMVNVYIYLSFIRFVDNSDILQLGKC